MSAKPCGCDPDCRNQDGTIGHVCERHRAEFDQAKQETGLHICKQPGFDPRLHVCLACPVMD